MSDSRPSLGDRARWGPSSDGETSVLRAREPSESWLRRWEQRRRARLTSSNVHNYLRWVADQRPPDHGVYVVFADGWPEPASQGHDIGGALAAARGLVMFVGYLPAHEREGWWQWLCKLAAC